MKFISQQLPSRESGKAVTAFVCTLMLGMTGLVVVQAQEREEEFTRRPYAGIGLGTTTLDPRTPNSSLTVSDDQSSGYHIAIGYDFTSRLSAEVYYADLGSAEIAFLGSDVGPIDYQVFGLSGIVYLFNSNSGFRANRVGTGMGTREGLSLYGRAGIGGVSADSELDYKVNNDVHLALGVGAEYGFGNGFALRGEYIAFDTDQQYASLSLVKRFGQTKRAAIPPVATLPKAVVPKPVQVAPKVTPEATEITQAPTLVGVPTVNFDFNESVITPAAAAKLDEVVAAVGQSDARLSLEGHTDWIDTESYNQALSIRRAESVRRYLESKGIARSRMSVQGFGETRPIATNSTDAGRAQNRRVNIRLN